VNKGLSYRAYGAHRKARGLPGHSPSAVKLAVDTGRIRLNAHGKIDPEAADREWARNTHPTRGRPLSSSKPRPRGPRCHDWMTMMVELAADLAPALADKPAAEIEAALTGELERIFQAMKREIPPAELASSPVLGWFFDEMRLAFEDDDLLWRDGAAGG
jgi:hypothetical protein